VDAGGVPTTKLAALAKCGLASKAPTLQDLEPDQQTATLLATVRHLETSSVDDALDVLDLLVASELLAKAERAGYVRSLKEAGWEIYRIEGQQTIPGPRTSTAPGLSHATDSEPVLFPL
jgi:hypothetical protein